MISISDKNTNIDIDGLDDQQGDSPEDFDNRFNAFYGTNNPVLPVIRDRKMTAQFPDKQSSNLSVPQMDGFSRQAESAEVSARVGQESEPDIDNGEEIIA